MPRKVKGMSLKELRACAKRIASPEFKKLCAQNTERLMRRLMGAF
jgi:hypothetical protein